MRPLALSALFLSALSLSAQITVWPGPAGRASVVSALPSASTASGQIVFITDGASTSDCSTGSGSSVVACKSNGTSWSATPIGNNSGGAINVRDAAYGAVGNGTTDDTSHLQAAITAAASANGSIIIPPGTYKYSTLTISGKTNLSITGYGAILLESADQSSAITVTTSPGLTIQGLTFNHATHNGNVFDVTSNNFSFINSTIENVGDGTTATIEVGLYVAPTSNDLQVKGCTFTTFLGNGTTSTRGVYVNNFRNTALASLRSRIVDNHFDSFSTTSGSNADAVVIDQQALSSFAIVSNNTFYNSATRAIKLLTNDVVMKGNTIEENNVALQAFSAISSYGERNLIEGNHAVAVGCNSGCSFYAGWDIAGSDNRVIGNYIENPSGSTDNPHNCLNVDIGSTTNSETSFDGIVFSNNECRNYTQARIVGGTPLTNLTANGNNFVGSPGGVGLQFLTGATVSGLTMTGNTIEAGNNVIAFVDGGTTGKTNLYIKGNGGNATPDNELIGANVASATTIAPVTRVFHVTGTTAIVTITPPVGFQGTTTGGCLVLIPNAIFTTTTAGNIALASTAVVGKALTECYDSGTTKWYPSY